MNIANKNIDGGKPFDWGKTSHDYAKFRDIYPQEFYNKIIKRKLCVDGQTVLDKSTPRLIQFYTFRNAIKPPFLGGFFVFGTSAA